jgi:hypothetical protein
MGVQRTRRWGRIAAIALAAGLALAPARAQEPHPLRTENAPVEHPDVSEPVLKRIEAPYLTAEERKDLRVFHGVWMEGDLDTPQRKAAAALIRGTYDDPVFKDGSVAAEDRAEAAARRGEYEGAIGLVKDKDSARAIRLRVESLAGLGKADGAVAASEPLLARLGSGELTRPEDVHEAVLAMIIRSRLHEQSRERGGDFKAMLGTLAKAREGAGRLYWPIYLTEARLLFEKDNGAQGGEAAKQALAMNPSSAEAWALIGRLAVDTFNFGGAEEVAEQLRKLDAESSPEAAEIIARAALRQNDPAGAEAALAPALQRFPKMRGLLALRAAAAALAYDEARTAGLMAEFEALSPGSALAYFEVGKALSEARQYEAAAGYLREATARAPHWAEPVIELGLLELQAGNDLASGDALRKAEKLDPFNIRAGNTLKLVDELGNYAKAESAHFVVRYKPGDDEVMATDMLAPLEAMYRRVTGNAPGGIDHEPPGKTTIDLMPDQRWFAVRIAGVTRIHTMAASTGPCIAMETPREGPRHTVGTYDWLRVVRHEFTHTVTLSRTHNRIPHWFTEAAAVYLEDSPRSYNTCQLLENALENDAMFDLREINNAFVRPKKPTDRSLAYAQGHWMYEYIIQRWGQRAPLDLMDRYAAGERQDAAFKRVLGLDEATFLDDFKGWAHEQLVAWGMAPRPGEPALARILLLEAASSDGGRSALAEKMGALTDGAAGMSAAGGPSPQWDPDLPKPSIAIVNKWLGKYPGHPGLLAAALSFTLAASDDRVTEDAVPLFERYAAARPVDPLPHQRLAKYYLDQEERRERAIPHLEWLDAREQNSPAYAAELARLYSAQQDWAKAGPKAERAAIIAPFDPVQRELAATVALQAKDYAAAVRHITALTRLEPTREIHKRRLEAAKRLAAEAAGQ